MSTSPNRRHSWKPKPIASLSIHSREKKSFVYSLTSPKGRRFSWIGGENSGDGKIVWTDETTWDLEELVLGLDSKFFVVVGSVYVNSNKINQFRIYFLPNRADPVSQIGLLQDGLRLQETQCFNFPT
ncbi:hypothetical protein L596_015284 [Steinernema carpocapsae]|uniref:Uncharacterized protein n=1 Tax=Steinernema carpocapsae TaxID=34508 RepID=A0A4U5NF44_STECR|nr:hypothetical protein L596_015284 [Steinernema carpocapsae]